MGPCPALARPNVAQILGADTHEQSSCCLTVPLPFRLVCGRLPDVVCSNDHLTAIRRRERAPSTTSKLEITALTLASASPRSADITRAKWWLYRYPDFVADASRNGDQANLCLPRAGTNESGLHPAPARSDTLLLHLQSHRQWRGCPRGA